MRCPAHRILFHHSNLFVLLSFPNLVILRVNKVLILQFPQIAICIFQQGKYREAQDYINTAAYNGCVYLMRSTW